MRKKLLLLAILLPTTFQFGFAQQKCATMYLDSLRRAMNPAMGTLAEFEAWMQQMSNKQLKSANPQTAAVAYMIPVIVHIINNGEAVGINRNISQAQVRSEIDVLNKDFRKWNADNANVPTVWKSIAGDASVNFCLVTKDPLGNTLAEPGIERINRQTKGWTAPPFAITYLDGTIKPATIWDPNKYYNIWVAEPYDPNNSSFTILGYATFPPGTSLSGLTGNLGSATTDGVVVRHTAFGTVGSVSAPSNKGRTCTHETGHWLGLRHIWGDATCGDDYVSDTPFQCDLSTGCPTFPNVSCCANGPNGDMFMDFMDYSDDACMIMFSQGQCNRIKTALTSSPMRINLTNSTVTCGYGVGIEDNDLNNRVSIYPNPSNGIIHVDIAMERATDMVIRVFNVLGELVKEITPVNTVSESVNIDLSNEPKGLYLVEVKTSTQMVSGKILLTGK